MTGQGAVMSVSAKDSILPRWQRLTTGPLAVGQDQRRVPQKTHSDAERYVGNIHTDENGFGDPKFSVHVESWVTAPRYLLRDRIYGKEFRNQVAVMNIKEVLSAPRSAVLMARSLRRTRQRFDSPRTSGPCDCLE